MWNNSSPTSPVISVRMKSHSAALQQVMSFHRLGKATKSWTGSSPEDIVTPKKPDGAFSGHPGSVGLTLVASHWEVRNVLMLLWFPLTQPPLTRGASPGGFSGGSSDLAAHLCSGRNHSQINFWLYIHCAHCWTVCIETTKASKKSYCYVIYRRIRKCFDITWFFCLFVFLYKSHRWEHSRQGWNDAISLMSEYLKRFLYAVLFLWLYSLSFLKEHGWSKG